MEKQIRELAEREGIVKNEPAMWVKVDSTTDHGRLILTAKRLIFLKNNVTNSLLKFFGTQAPQSTIEIDLDTINSVMQEKFLVDKNILSIRYLQYEMARFSVLCYEDWEKAIHEQQMTPHID